MEKIYNIRYVDAYYTYEKNLGETKLSPHEAYGYLEKNDDSLVIIFIKKVDYREDQNIIKGLVIPRGALASVSGLGYGDKLKDLSVGSRVKMEWRDVVYVANQPRRDTSRMYTEGVLVKIERDHLVIKDPETIRTYPKPLQNHPGGGLPTYLIVPISFITNISVIK